SQIPPPSLISTLSLHDALPISQRQHQDGRHCKSKRPAQLAEGISSVLQNLAQPLKRSLVAMQLRRLLHASVGDSGRPSCIFTGRSEEHTSELQSLAYLVCRLLL